MTIFEIATVLIVLTALFSFLNYRTVRLPTTIGVMLVALTLSLVLVVLAGLGVTSIIDAAQGLIDRIDFNETLLHGMLAFLLFAGALEVNLNDLANSKWTISILATVGVMASTVMVGTLAWLGLNAMGLSVSLHASALMAAHTARI